MEKVQIGKRNVYEMITNIAEQYLYSVYYSHLYTYLYKKHKIGEPCHCILAILDLFSGVQLPLNCVSLADRNVANICIKFLIIYNFKLIRYHQKMMPLKSKCLFSA